MTQQLAQTVGSNRKFAWLLAIVAAFAVFAAVANKTESARADIFVSGGFATNFCLDEDFDIGPEPAECFNDPASPSPGFGSTTERYELNMLPLTIGTVGAIRVRIDFGVDVDISNIDTGEAGVNVDCTETTNGLICDLGAASVNLPTGTSGTIEFDATFFADFTAASLVFTVEDLDSAQDPVPGVNQLSDVSVISGGTLSKTPASQNVSFLGGTVQQVITWTNGPDATAATAGNIQITDAVPAGVTVTSVTVGGTYAGVITCPATPWVGGSSFTCTSDATAAAAGQTVILTLSVSVPAAATNAATTFTDTATADIDYPGFPNRILTDTAVIVQGTLADFLADSVIRHYDADAGSESAADGDGSGDGFLLGNDGDIDECGVFAPNTDSDCDVIEDDDEAIGAVHTVCIVDTPLTFTADAGFIEWVIEDSELNPTITAGVELSSNDLPVDPSGAESGVAGSYTDAPCFQWSSVSVGDQDITAIYDPDGDDVGLAGIPIRFDGVNGSQPLVKEWNSIDTTIIVAVSGVVGGDATPDGNETLGDNTGELANWDTGGTTTVCERDRNATTNWCGSRANQDGATVSVTGTLTAGGFVLPGTSRSFIEYTLGAHTTHFSGPVDGAEQVFTYTGCGSVLIEDPETGDVIQLDGGESATVISSNYGVGFTFLARSSAGDLECRPGDEGTLTIATSQVVVGASAEDTAPLERITVNFFAQQVAKQPILAWAGQRIQLAHEWLDGEGGCLFDELRIGDVYARYEIERGDGAFVSDARLGTPEGDDVFHASLGGVNLPFATDPCVSYAIYEQEFQGQVDIKATLEVCDSLLNGPVEAAQVSDVECDGTGFVYNFLVYYMEFEDITLGAVGGAREHHNGGLFDPTGNINDASTDTATATANVSADVLLRARVRGWFKTDSLDTSGTNRPALDGKPSGRYVMPDDWLLLAGGDTALLFRPNYDTMLTPGGALSCGSNVACDSSPMVGVPVSTANPSVGNNPVVGPFSLLDPGPGNNSSEFGGRETFLPDGQINKWDAPMPPALVTFSYVGETASTTAVSSGFLKEALKFLDVYQGQNPYYLQAIPESPILNPQNYLWDTWGGDGRYEFWQVVLKNRFPNSLASSPHGTSTELGQIQGQHSEDIGRILNVYSDNHGEAMIFANGDFRLTYDDCDTNVIGGGKHCTIGDKVGTSNVYAVADYPDFKKKPQIASTPVAITWTWGGYKEVTIEAGETDQFKYVVFHAIDRDQFCSLPTIQAEAYDLGGNSQFRGTPVTGGVNDRALKPVWLSGATLTFTNTGVPHLVTLSTSLHPVLSSLDATNTIGANDPVESVDFIVDAGEGIVVNTSAGTGVIDPTKRFVTGVPTFSTALNTTIKEFPTLHGSTDECQAWIRVSNSLLGILNVIVTAHDDEGDIAFDTIVDFQGTMSYTLSFRWTLLTYAGPTVPVADALKGTGANDAGNDIFDQVTAVYGWDEGTQQWEGFFPEGVNVPGANDLTQLVTGEAYWIAIKGPGPVTWTVATNVGG